MRRGWPPNLFRVVFRDAGCLRGEIVSMAAADYDRELPGAPAPSVVPSWVISFALHLAILLFFANMSLTPARIGIVEGDDFRPVGLQTEGVVEVGSKTGDDEASPNANTSESPQDRRTPAAAPDPGGTSRGMTSDRVASNPGPTAPTIDDAPPVPISLPKSLAPFDRLGPGAPQAGSAADNDLQRLSQPRTGPTQSTRTTPRGGMGREGVSGTSFFGGEVKGTRFVYVVDGSGSMASRGAMSAAKTELLASLRKLQSTQQFGIIFYSDRPRPMRLPNGLPGVFFATETNLQQAEQYIRSVTPDGGTNHVDAIKMAIALGGDVLFLLTDAADPSLSAGELEEVRKRNGGRMQIHTVEFNVGADLTQDNNFLKKLARQNDGSYTYRDVDALRPR